MVSNYFDLTINVVTDDELTEAQIDETENFINQVLESVKLGSSLLTHLPIRIAIQVGNASYFESEVLGG